MYLDFMKPMIDCTMCLGFARCYKFTLEPKPFWKDIQNCAINYAPLSKIM